MGGIPAQERAAGDIPAQEGRYSSPFVIGRGAISAQELGMDSGRYLSPVLAWIQGATSARYYHGCIASRCGPN